MDSPKEKTCLIVFYDEMAGLVNEESSGYGLFGLQEGHFL